MKETSIDNSGSKSISSLMFSPIDERDHQKRMEPMVLSPMNIVCHTCNDSKAIIFDAENNETVCTPVGSYFVIK